jgi:hypothetical protein
VFKSNTLVDYCVKLYKQKYSPDKRDLMLTSLSSCIAHYTITTIVVAIPDAHCITSEFEDLRTAIERFAAAHEIPVIYYPVRDVYFYLGRPVQRTRLALMKRLSMFFPELSRYQEKEMRNKNKYYVKLFEAVGVATHHWMQTSSIKKAG